MKRSNLVFLEHVNFTQPDQRLATAFYVSGLGLTRDPYLMVGPDNMWINVGRSQIHLPSRAPRSQRLPGAVGLVVPRFEALADRLALAQPWLRGTQFAYEVRDGLVVATCPWGNRYECRPACGVPGREADSGYGPGRPEGGIGMPYVRIAVAPGTARGIARFYTQVMAAHAEWVEEGPAGCRVMVGQAQWLHFQETDAALPDYDGHHIQLYIDDFAGPRGALESRGLLAATNGDEEWRFTDIVDLDSGRVLHRLEHEVRSLRHPLFGRAHVNRDPDLNVANYRHGRGPLPPHAPAAA